eukprot:5628035-Pyramimonas_sp.AAC.1
MPASPPVLRTKCWTLHKHVSAQGLRMNDAKSVVLIKPAGKNSRRAQQHLIGDGTGAGAEVVSSEHVVKVRVVRTYELPGTYRTDKMSLNAEITHRASSMRAHLRPIRTSIAPRKALPISSKFRYTDSIAGSKLLCNAS